MDKSLLEQLSFELNAQHHVLTNNVYFVIKWVTGWGGAQGGYACLICDQVLPNDVFVWKTNGFWDHLLLSLQFGQELWGD